jgi:hypothetical protein
MRQNPSGAGGPRQPCRATPRRRAPHGRSAAPPATGGAQERTARAGRLCPTPGRAVPRWGACRRPPARWGLRALVGCRLRPRRAPGVRRAPPPRPMPSPCAGASPWGVATVGAGCRLIWLGHGHGWGTCHGRRQTFPVWSQPGAPSIARIVQQPLAAPEPPDPVRHGQEQRPLPATACTTVGTPVHSPPSLRSALGRGTGRLGLAPLRVGAVLGMRLGPLRPLACGAGVLLVRGGTHGWSGCPRPLVAAGRCPSTSRPASKGAATIAETPAPRTQSLQRSHTLKPRPPWHRWAQRTALRKP